MSYTVCHTVLNVKRFLLANARGNPRRSRPVSECCQTPLHRPLRLDFAERSGFPGKLFSELESVPGVLERLLAELVGG